MQRRHLLGSLAALSVVTVARKGRAQARSAASLVPATSARFDNGLSAARAASLEFVETGAGKEPSRLMSFLAMWGVTVPRDTRKWTSAWVLVPGANATFEFNTLSSGRPFVVTAFRMGRGCVIPAHCHPGGGG